ncbi:MAG: response regulator [Chloroflexota bacterium]|nr:response regulator [Chloroflexota bacterium]
MAKHILVINDTQEILQLFGEILTGEGYEVTLQPYGQEEISDVRRLMPDLIICDFPPLDREQHGWQFIQKVKMTRDLAKIPLVVCTTNLKAIEQNQGWLVSKGALIIPKPFKIDELLDAVKQQLGDADSPDAGPFASQIKGLKDPS